MSHTAPARLGKIALAASISLVVGAVQAQPLPAKPASAATPAAVDAAASAASEPRIIRGTDKVLGAVKASTLPDGPPNSFKFEDAPIADVIQLVLKDILKLDFVLHPPVNGTVTLATQEISNDQAVFLLEAALQANGIAMVRDARGMYHVGRPDVLKGIVPSVRMVSSAPLPPGSGAIIVPLKYIGANEMASILRPLVPPDSLLRIDTVRNLLILAGSRTQAEGWLDMVNTFDVDLLKGMSVGVFPLKYATTKEVEAALKLMTTGAPAAPAAAGSPGGAGGNAAAQTPATGDATPFYGAIKILPIERINSLLVVTPRAAYLDDARAWIEKLDRPTSNSAERVLNIYPVQNGSAQHLASVLSGLFGTGSTGSDAGSNSTGVAPGLSVGTAQSGGFSNNGLAGNPFGSNLSGGSGFGFSSGTGLSGTGMSGFGSTQGTGNAGTARTQLAGATLGQNGPRVMADNLNNIVLVYGTASEFAKIESTLRRLDIPPTQVLIEASIIEVTLNDDLQYGLQWFFTDKARDGLTGTGVLSSNAGGTLGGALAGFSYTLRNSLGNVKAILNALATKSLVNVISSPSLMVLDNHVASISVGNQQPVQAGQAITTGGVVSNNIQYKDTGVNLAVTPSVNSGNMVTLQINQGVTDVGDVDAATGQRAFLQRQINTKVAVRSGETIVLGGLIRDNNTNGKNGLPLLQDIPVVGNLFGATRVSTARTELLVVLTPKVVRTDVDVRQVSEELRDRLKSGFDWSNIEKSSKLSKPGVPSKAPGLPPAEPLPAGESAPESNLETAR